MKPLARLYSRRFLAGAILFVIPVLCWATVPKPNFVIILVDDMGWTGLSGYGSDLHKTPHIDRLADGGMKFTQAYASASICTPTRAALLTGKYPARLNMTIWHEMSQRPQKNRRLTPPVVEGNLSHAEVTLAEVLRDTGYTTGHIGKWHLGEASHYPETHGFDYSFGGSFWGAPATFYFPYRGLWGSGENSHPRYIPGIDANEDREGEHLTDRITDEALDFIDRSAKQRFFLYLSYYTVHTPIEGKPELAEKYSKRIRPGMIHDDAHYAAMHETLDDNVGRILAKLEATGLADQTVVILTSDNGGYINEYNGQTVTSNHPLRSGKGSLYEGGIRVPLIIRWPGHTKPGSQSGEPVHTADFYPTILEMTGLANDPAPNEPIDGISLTHLLKDPDHTLTRDALYWHYPHYYPATSPVSAVRQGKWKLLEYLEDSRLELFNLEEDMGETQNLATSHAGLTNRLRDKLHQWRKDVDAPMPTVNPDFRF